MKEKAYIKNKLESHGWKQIEQGVYVSNGNSTKRQSSVTRDVKYWDDDYEKWKSEQLKMVSTK